jgi:hypothetical protein
VSRYQIPTHRPSHSCELGWDPPLATFFAQVFDHDALARDNPPAVWIGTAYAEVPSAADLARLLAPWAQLDTDLVTRLEQDRLDHPARARRPELDALVDALFGPTPPHPLAEPEPEPPDPA